MSTNNVNVYHILHKVSPRLRLQTEAEFHPAPLWHPARIRYNESSDTKLSDEGFARATRL